MLFKWSEKGYPQGEEVFYLNTGNYSKKKFLTELK